MRVLKFLKRLLKARANGLIRLRKVSKPTRLDCIGGECGLCCRVLGGTNVEPDEMRPLIDVGMIEIDEGVTKLRCVRSSCCALLQDQRCTLYDYRPRGCKEYPWYNIDGKLYFDTGCPGIRHDFDDHPTPETLRPAEFYFPVAQSMQRLLLWLVRWW